MTATNDPVAFQIDAVAKWYPFGNNSVFLATQNRFSQSAFNNYTYENIIPWTNKENRPFNFVQ